MARPHALDLVTSQADSSVPDDKSQRRQRCGSSSHESTSAALDDAFPAADVGLLRFRFGTGVRLQLELSMVRVVARRVFVFPNYRARKQLSFSERRAPAPLLLLYAVVFFQPDQFTGNGFDVVLRAVGASHFIEKHIALDSFRRVRRLAHRD